MAQESAEAAKYVASTFADAINQHDVADLTSLMTDDHVFIDSLGSRIEGRLKMKAGWEAYFRMVPDYTITIEETYVNGAVVVLWGTAQGTYSSDGTLRPENRWLTPAAWRALVRGSQIAEWRVIADNEPIRQIIARNRK